MVNSVGAGLSYSRQRIMTEKEEKSQHCQASSPCVFLIGLAVILVLSLPFIILNVRELFRAKEVKIGILEPSGSEKTFEKIAFTAVEIFNLNSRDGKLSVYSRHNSSESVPDVFRRLYGDGVRVFLLSEEVRTEEQEEIEEEEGKVEECIFLSNSPVGPSSGLRVISIQPDHDTLARTHLTAINSTGNLVTILPIMRDDPAVSLLYRAVRAGAREFPNIRLVNPVVYSRTEYSRSDAFQVINSLGKVILSKPEADLLLLTSDLLPDLLAVTHLNPSLATRVWWAVGAAGLGERLRAGRRGRRQSGGSMVRTISFLGTEEEESLRQEYLAQFLQTGGRAPGSLYSSWLLYSHLSAMTGVSDLSQTSSKVRQFLSLTLDQEDHLNLLPSFPWTFSSLLRVNSTDVTTENLSSVRLGDVSNSLDLKCKEPSVEVSIPAQTFLPPVTRRMAGREGEDLFLPALEGAEVRLSCEEEEYVCSPLDPLTCRPLTVRRRGKRESVGELWSGVGSQLERIRASWRSLLPNIVSCTASVAGNSSTSQGWD